MANKGNVPWNKGIKTNKPAYNSLSLDKDELYDLYIDQELSTTDIAKLLGCSARTIQNWLHRYEIPVRSDGDSVKLNRSKWTDERELSRSRAVHQAWANKSQEEKELIAQRKRDNPNINSPESIKKANLTRIANGTTKQSKSENDFYHKLLILGFDKDDIIHHYMSDKYPFNCDFYIKSKDLYIEYQGHFTHGFEPFDENNEEHIEYLAAMQDAGKDMSTWFKRDPKKLEIAKRNKVNLLLVYPRHKNYLVQNGQVTTIDINDINKI